MYLLIQGMLGWVLTIFLGAKACEAWRVTREFRMRQEDMSYLEGKIQIIVVFVFTEVMVFQIWLDNLYAG